VLTYIEFI